MAAVRKHAPWEVVARIAGCVVGKHEDDVRVGYAETFHGSIPAHYRFRRGHSLFEKVMRERRTFLTHSPYASIIRRSFQVQNAYSGTTDAYAVIEPIPGCTDKNRPVIRM
jgi:hypothetical protein